jgi:anaerobic magnesium-protoporphyrin IX monomethyl ester cyclase
MTATLPQAAGPDRASAFTSPRPRLQRVVFFQPRTWAAAHYTNGAGAEQTWTPWFAPFLAGAARAAGLHTELVDARIDPCWRQRIAAIGPADVLAASVMTGAAITDAVEASTVARELGAYVIWGGPHPTLFPQQTLQQSPAHAVVPTFGYAGLQLLLAHLTGHRQPPGPTLPRVLTETGPIPGTGPQVTLPLPRARPR